MSEEEAGTTAVATEPTETETGETTGTNTGTADNVEQTSGGEGGVVGEQGEGDGEGEGGEQHEAREGPTKEEVQKMTAAMCDAVAAYLQGELLATSEDYRLLERMNLAVAGKYASLTELADSLAVRMAELQAQHQVLDPYLHQIDSIYENVEALEQAVVALDEYTRRLAQQFSAKDAQLKRLQQRA